MRQEAVPNACGFALPADSFTSNKDEVKLKSSTQEKLQESGIE
jgi:hypothetical protein